MTRNALSALLLMLAVSPTYGNLGLERIEACYGKAGPARNALEFFLYDEVHFRFVITGAKDDDGQLDVTCSWSVFDDKGKEVKAKKGPFKGPVAFGVDALSFGLGFYLPETSNPGEYLLKATVKDNISGEEVGFERKLKLKATEFAVVSPQFFHHAQFTVGAPADGFVGQQLHFRMWTIGFDRSKDKIIHDVKVEVLDKGKKVELSKPFHIPLEQDNKKSINEQPAIGFSGWMGLSKPGEFILRITVTDQNSKKTATFETSLRVMAP